MKKLLLSFFAHLLCLACFTQASADDVALAARKGSHAVTLMESGKVYEAISELKECRKLDPDAIFYPLQLALAYFNLGSDRKAIQILEDLRFHKNANPSVYILLYQCWQREKNEIRAVAMLDKGIELFPKSGQLCAEKALYYFDKGDSASCMQWLDKGIVADPHVSINYFYRSLLYLNRRQTSEALASAEMFMFYQKSQVQVHSASRLLFQMQADSMRKLNPWLGFDQTTASKMNMKLQSEFLLDSVCAKMLQEKTYGYYTSSNKALNARLDSIHAQVSAAGLHEAYLYWLYRFGDPKSFNEWRQLNPDAWKRFSAWRGVVDIRPIKISLPEQTYTPPPPLEQPYYEPPKF